MVCSLKSGIMAALARLLAAGSVSQTLAEEVDRQKLTAKYLHRELQEADEANLLDEEDMHMFGLRPMADPLYLVCCNACKKPIKASHYATHAEICKLLNYKEEIVSEVDGASGQKKLPRKNRKKLHIAHATRTIRKQEKLESVDSDIITTPESHFDEELQMTPLAGAKRNTKCEKETPRMNSFKVNPGNMERSETVIPSHTKHVKREISEIQSCPDVKTQCITSEDVLQYVPAPLATKMYYSQRNHHLRRVISHMYYAESGKEQSCEFLTLEEFRDNSEQTQTSSPSYLNYGQVENPQRGEHSLHLGQTSDQIHAGSSGLYLGKSQGFVPATNISSPFQTSHIVDI